VIARTGIGRDLPYERGATALLLVDMQRIWVEPGHDSANPHGEAEAYHRRLAELVVPKQVRLLHAARGGA
jgi:biuret amidohydrolase